MSERSIVGNSKEFRGWGADNVFFPTPLPLPLPLVDVSVDVGGDISAHNCFSVASAGDSDKQNDLYLSQC
jgi:hypothetical protein